MDEQTAEAIAALRSEVAELRETCRVLRNDVDHLEHRKLPDHEREVDHLRSEVSSLRSDMERAR